MNTSQCFPGPCKELEMSRFGRFLRFFGKGKERAPQAIRVVCSRGILWITREGDARDYIVAAGESLTLNDAQRLVVLPLRANEEIEYSICAVDSRNK